ncbi:glycosyltransferase [Kineothrix sedimenti]|uniref:Glycosyltransferase n=1 Tax=Kineothrix sedimenti TaxID=3123317 RepID=A0ABZ3EUJ4_9FIRM
MADKKVSIIVPVYNGEEYVERCINSLLAQTYENVEIIIIDDGSTDRSGQTCDTFSEKYDKIKTIHVENTGVSAARNRGIDEAKGYYISFVDVDDYLETDTLDYLINILEETGSDIAGCNFHTFLDEQEKQILPKENANKEVLNGKDFIEEGILSGDTRCWAKVYTTRIVDGKRFETGLTIGEDMLFLLELMEEGTKICRSSYEGYGYFVNESGAMKRKFKESYMDQITCWKRAVERIGNFPEMRPKAVSILMISIMLVVGKLSVLSAKERRAYTDCIKACTKEMKKCREEKAAYKELSLGYKVKTTVFGQFPRLYLNAYHLFKTRE